MLRVGILGTETMGTLHAHHLRRISDVHLIGVTAEPASEADALAASLGVQRYNSAERRAHTWSSCATGWIIS